MMLLILKFMLMGFIYSMINPSARQRGALYCGLAGFSAYDGKKVDITKMRMLLLLNQPRGVHATGVYGTQLFKSTILAEDFIKLPAFNTAVAGARSVVGHTRFATHGDKTDRVNAHPFSVSNGEIEIHGTHNGGIFSDHIQPLADKYGLAVPTVDSKLIYEILVKSGMDWNSIGDIEGNMALAFIHEGMLHLYRRRNRPLFIGESEEGVYYSSIEETLEMIGCTGITDVQPWTVFRFNKGVVDRQWIPKKPVVVNLPMDASTSRALSEKGLTQKERDEITKYRQKSTIGFKQKKAGKGGKETEDDSFRGSDFSENYTETGSRTATSIIRSLESEVLDSAKALEIDINSTVDELRKSHLSSESILALNLVDRDSGNKKIPQMLAWIDGHPEINGISLDNGLLVIKIPKSIANNDHVVKLVDPFTDFDVLNGGQANFFTTKLNLKKGRILEVILQLPFLFDEPKHELSSQNGVQRVSKEEERSEENTSTDRGSDENESDYDGQDPVGPIQKHVETPWDKSRDISRDDEGEGDEGSSGGANGGLPDSVLTNNHVTCIWEREGFDNMAEWVMGSDNDIAHWMRENEIAVVDNSFTLMSTQKLPSGIKRFMGNEQVKSGSVKRVKPTTAPRKGYDYNGLTLYRKYLGKESWLECRPDDFLYNVNIKSESASEKMSYLGGSIDEISDVLAGIGVTEDELRASLSQALAALNTCYEEATMDKEGMTSIGEQLTMKY